MIRRIPYKLPQKRKRVKSGIERAPKRIWPRHRRHVKSRHCCVPGCQSSAVDLAHLRSVANGCGTSLRPFDWYTVPLCRFHHEEQEPIGPDAAGDRWGIDLWEIAAELVRTSPDWKMRAAMVEQQRAETAARVIPIYRPRPKSPAMPAFRLAGDAHSRMIPIVGFVS